MAIPVCRTRRWSTGRLPLLWVERPVRPAYAPDGGRRPAQRSLLDSKEVGNSPSAVAGPKPRPRRPLQGHPRNLSGEKNVPGSAARDASGGIRRGSPAVIVGLRPMGATRAYGGDPGLVGGRDGRVSGRLRLHRAPAGAEALFAAVAPDLLGPTPRGPADRTHPDSGRSLTLRP